MRKAKIIYNKTLKEYKETYPNYKDLEKYNKDEVKNKEELLKDKTWWLIEDTYYEAPKNEKNPFLAWWANLGKGARTAICILGGAIVVTAIVVPTVIGVKSCATTRKIIVYGEVNHSSSFNSDGSLTSNITPKSSDKEIDKLDIKIGDYTLQNDEYSFDNNKLTIVSTIIKAHKGDVVITVTLKDKGIKINKITITNTNKSVGVGNKLELIAKVEPETATDKDVTFTIVTGGTGDGSIEKDGGGNHT